MTEFWWGVLAGTPIGIIAGFALCLVLAALIRTPPIAEPRTWTGDLPTHLNEDETDDFLRDLNNRRDAS